MRNGADSSSYIPWIAVVVGFVVLAAYLLLV